MNSASGQHSSGFAEKVLDSFRAHDTVRFMPMPLESVSLALAGAIASPLVVRFSTWVSNRQPIAHEPAAESALISRCCDNPSLVSELVDAGFEPGSFSSATYNQAWALLVNGDAISPQLVDAARSASEGCDLSDEQVAIAVVAASDDRSLDHSHAASDINYDDQTNEWSRTAPSPTAVRYSVAALYCAVFGVIAGSWAPGPISAILMMALGLFGFAISATDHDTLMIDLPSFLVATPLFWAVSFLAAANGETSTKWVLAGIAASISWGIALWLINAAYKLLRGMSGIGTGDSIIIFIYVTVPVALTQSAFMAIYSVVGAMTVALAVTLPMAALGKRGKQDHFALGPYLSIGWAVAWAFGKAMAWL